MSEFDVQAAIASLVIGWLMVDFLWTHIEIRFEDNDGGEE